MLTLNGLHSWWSVVYVVRTNICVLASVYSVLRAGHLIGFDMQHFLLGSNAAVSGGLLRVWSGATVTVCTYSE